MKKRDKWLSIETAHFEMISPSGRAEDAEPWLSWCLLFVPSERGGIVMVGGMDAGMWLGRDETGACWELEIEPTHWMPLPLPPTTP